MSRSAVNTLGRVARDRGREDKGDLDVENRRDHWTKS